MAGGKAVFNSVYSDHYPAIHYFCFVHSHFWESLSLVLGSRG